jgi:hypothetical protein
MFGYAPGLDSQQDDVSIYTLTLYRIKRFSPRRHERLYGYRR